MATAGALLYVCIVLTIGASMACPTEIQAEIQEPPRPYSFAYSAGRYPGHTDRAHVETRDPSGITRGSYQYVDPRYQLQTVEYVADDQGIHIQASNLPKPRGDTPVVAAAKQRHLTLFEKIAAEHALIRAQLEQERAARGGVYDDGQYVAVAP